MRYSEEKPPICCGKKMYPCGGTIAASELDEINSWRCDVCKNEIDDINYQTIN